MTTVGIDLASQPSKTAVARLEWEAGSARVISLVLGADDEVLLEVLSRADQVAGIDCPFGWPEKFVELVSAHAAGTLAMEPVMPAGWKRDYVLRATDIDVHERTGLTPLSVAADRIGHTAIRNAEARVGLVDAHTEAAPWLDLGDHDALCRASDYALDAVICALVPAACRWARPNSPPTARPRGGKTGSTCHGAACGARDAGVRPMRPLRGTRRFRATIRVTHDAPPGSLDVRSD